MSKEFVPYEQSLQLVQIGFKEPCYGYYDSNRTVRSHSDYPLMMCDYNSEEGETENEIPISAPLYQQVFRWFRKKHDLCSHIQMYNGEFHFVINEAEHFFKYDTTTYESAELACINKLIEIVKNNT